MPNKYPGIRALVVGTGPELARMCDALTTLEIEFVQQPSSREGMTIFRSEDIGLLIIGLRVRPISLCEFVAGTIGKLAGKVFIVPVPATGPLTSEVYGLHNACDSKSNGLMIIPHDEEEARLTIELVLDS